MASQVPAGTLPPSAPHSDSLEVPVRRYFYMSEENCGLYKTELGRELEKVHVARVSAGRKGSLYLISGIVLGILGAAAIHYLKVVVPRTYVWPAIMQLSFAFGITGLFFGGFVCVAFAMILFNRAADSSRFSDVTNWATLKYFSEETRPLIGEL